MHVWLLGPLASGNNASQHCVQFDPADNASYFAVDYNATQRRFQGRFLCMAGCATSRCRAQLANVSADACSFLPQLNASASLRFADELAACGASDNDDDSGTGRTIAAVLSSLAAVGGLAGGVLLLRRWRRRQDRRERRGDDSVLPKIDAGPADADRTGAARVQPCTALTAAACAAGRWCRATFGLSWTLSSRTELYEILLMLCAAVAWTAQVVMAWTAGPFTVFADVSFDSFGLSEQYVDTSNAESLFQPWAAAWRVLVLILGIGLWCGALARFVVVRPTISAYRWSMVRAVCLGCALLGQFALFMAPPFFCNFMTAVSMRANNVSFINNSSDIRSSLDSIMGYSFLGIVCSFLANLYLNIIHGLAVGVYVGCLLGLLTLRAGSHWTLVGIWDMSAGRIMAAICILLLLEPIQGTLPVIVLYQSFGVDAAWIVLWGIAWGAPFVLFYHLHRLVGAVRTEGATQRTQRNLRVNLLLYCIVYVATTAYLLDAGRQLRHLAVGFPSALLFSVICVTTALVFVLTQIYLISLAGTIFTQATLRPPKAADLMINSVAEPDDAADEEQAPSLHSDGAGDGSDSDDSDASEDTRPLRRTARGRAGPCARWCSRECRCVWRAAGALATLTGPFWRWLAETAERENPERYGNRVTLRRLFLLIGIVADGYIVFDMLSYSLNESVKQQVQELLASMDAGFQWPDDANGGTLFDRAFELYGTARWYAFGLLLVAFALLLLALLADFGLRSRRGLWWSRLFGYASLALLYFGVIATALPNYLRATPVNQICPHCAPQFDNMVALLGGDMVGIVCAVIFTLNLLPVLLAVPAAMVRSARLILINRHLLYERAVARVPRSQCGPDNAENVRFVFALSALLSPLLTALPMVMFYQLFGDAVVGVLIAFFWIAPAIVGQAVTVENSSRIYWAWLTCYVGGLVAVIVYEILLRGLAKPIEQELQSVSFYAEIAAEICLANVIISDLFFSSIERDGEAKADA